MTHFMHDPITFHSDGYEDYKPAINVKYHGSYRGSLPEDYHDALGKEAKKLIERAWSHVEYDWWVEAEELAQARGYSGVFSEGRSGGWLVPYYGFGEYTHYPDVEDFGERSRFLSFQRAIKHMLEDVPDMLREEVAYLVELRLEEYKRERVELLCEGVS